MQEGLLWGCVAFLWCGFSVSVYLPSSWCVTCRKFAFLFCLGCNWAVFLVRQVKLDTTEFLEKPFFAIVCWNLKLRGVEWGQMTDDGMCSVKCVSNYQVFIYPLLLLASELWMEKKNCETEVKSKMVVILYLSTVVWGLLWGKEALPFLEAAAEGLVKPKLLWNYGGVWTARILPLFCWTGQLLCPFLTFLPRLDYPIALVSYPWGSRRNNWAVSSTPLCFLMQ